MPQGITIFCGSASGVDPQYIRQAELLGQAIAHAGLPLIYGGGRMGLMGAVGRSCRAAGGHTVCVIPQFMVDRGWNDPDASETIITDTMHTRKATMARLSQAVIALPGGIGTFEELTEIICHRQLGIYHGNIVLLNINGFYDPFIATLRSAITAGFMPSDHARLWTTATTAAEALSAAITITPDPTTHLSPKF